MRDRPPIPSGLFPPRRLLAGVAVAVALVGCSGSTLVDPVYPALEQLSSVARCDLTATAGTCVSRDAGLGVLVRFTQGQSRNYVVSIENTYYANRIYACDPVQVGSCSYLAYVGASTGISQLLEANGLLYVAVQNGQILRCDPTVVDSCVQIYRDPNSTAVDSLTYGNGTLYAGMDDGRILSCNPATANACSLLNQGGGKVQTLLFANNRLYAGLNDYQGTLWSCDPVATNSCLDLNKAGKTAQYTAMTFIGNRIFAGVSGSTNFGPTILWNCDPNVANSCLTVFDSDRDVPGDKSQFQSGPFGIQASGERVFFTDRVDQTDKLYSCDPNTASSCYRFQVFN